MSASGRSEDGAGGSGGAEADREAILRTRARSLAEVREIRKSATVSILPFEIGSERYGVEAAAVHQVLDASGVSPLLGAPRGVIGAIVSRTKPVPVLDLRHILGLADGGLSDLRRVVVLEDAGDLFGIAVERVSPRLDLAPGELLAGDGAVFKWIGPDRLAVIDPARIGLGEREDA